MGKRLELRGFSQVELIVVIVITGVLAATAIPRFVTRDSFDSRGFYDLAISSVRFAQKTAIAWRREVHVCVSGNAIIAGTAAGCGTQVMNSTTGQPIGAVAPSDVTLAGSSFSFDGAGRPIPNSQITIAVNSTIPGDPARQIVVEAETGYVHP